MSSRVIISGVEKFGKREFQTIQRLSIKQLSEIAKITEITIQRKIQESLQRPGSTGNLANSFFAEPIGTNGWGIGNISYLNTHAKYWRWINFGVAGTGRTTPPTTTGTFSPGNNAPNGADFRTGRFTHSSSSGFLLTPTKPIQAHNYIARTLVDIPNIISSALTRIKR
jgi:hypothetical protein